MTTRPKPSTPAGWAPKAIKPLKTLGTFAEVTAVLWTLLVVAQAAAAPVAVETNKRILAAGGRIGDELTGFAALSLPWSAIILISYFISCAWLFRARANTMLTNPEFRHARGLSWPWVSWWFPLLSLWFPYQVVRDVVLAAHARVNRKVLHAWWAAWLFSLYTAVLASSSGGNGGGPVSESTLDTVVPLTVGSAIGSVVALVCWIHIVRAVTAAG